MPAHAGKRQLMAPGGPIRPENDQSCQGGGQIGDKLEAVPQEDAELDYLWDISNSRSALS